MMQMKPVMARAKSAADGKRSFLVAVEVSVVTVFVRNEGRAARASNLSFSPTYIPFDTYLGEKNPMWVGECWSARQEANSPNHKGYMY